jgi:hypothetical protein
MLKGLKVVAGYSREERETVIVYEEETNTYDIYSSVPFHIRSLIRRFPNVEPFHLELNPVGECTAIRFKVNKLPPAGTFRPSSRSEKFE